MANELDPIVGQWYAHRDKGEMFRVVAVDAATERIETQSFDGDVEELEIEAWREMEIETAEAPEDWTGPFDDIESDDLGLTETDDPTGLAPAAGIHRTCPTSRGGTRAGRMMHRRNEQRRRMPARAVDNVTAGKKNKYYNRAGTNLDSAQGRVLEEAKERLRELFRRQ